MSVHDHELVARKSAALLAFYGLVGGLLLPTFFGAASVFTALVMSIGSGSRDYTTTVACALVAFGFSLGSCVTVWVLSWVNRHAYRSWVSITWSLLCLIWVIIFAGWAAIVMPSGGLLDVTPFLRFLWYGY